MNKNSNLTKILLLTITFISLICILGFFLYKSFQISNFTYQNKNILKQSSVLLTNSIKIFEDLDIDKLNPQQVKILKKNSQDIINLKNFVIQGSDNSTRQFSSSLSLFLDSSSNLILDKVQYTEFNICYKSLQKDSGNLKIDSDTERGLVIFYASLIPTIENFNKCSADTSSYQFPENLIPSLTKISKDLEDEFSEEKKELFITQMEILDTSILDFQSRQEEKLKENQNNLQNSLQKLESSLNLITVF
jgi:hypothetical protein